MSGDTVGSDETSNKVLRKGLPQRPLVLEREEVSNAIHEGDRILGLPKEYSGWDVYNNEAKKMDTELVKDWTSSLNFLLLFVSSSSKPLTPNQMSS